MSDQNEPSLHDAIGALSCPTKVSFQTDIKPLFTEMDRDHMSSVTSGALNLWDFNSVKIYASVIFKKVSTGQMPPAGSGEKPWTPDQVNLFGCWMQQKCQP